MADNQALEQTPEEILQDKKGAFASSLTRDNKQIRVGRVFTLILKEYISKD